MAIREYLRGKFNSGIVKNLATLVGGSAIAQLIGITLSPIISRLYTPEHFGILGSILAITGIISLVGSLKYDLAIVIENNDKDAQTLQDLNIFVLLGVTIISGIGILTAPYWLNQLEAQPELVTLLPWAIPIIFFSALYNIFYSRFNREKAYKTMATIQILRRIAIVGIQVIFGFLFASTLGLILGNVLGVLIPLGYIFYYNRNFIPIGRFNLGELQKVAKRYYKFPIYTAPQSILNLSSAQLPIFVLGYFFSLEVVGAYFFTIKFVQLPAMLIGLSVRQVFYKEAAEMVGNIPKLRNLYQKTTLGLTAIVVLPSIILFVFGIPLFVFVFGEEWALAGTFASWMFLWYGSNMVAGPARALFLTLEMQKTVFVLDMVLIAIRAICLIFFSMHYSPTIVIAVFSVITLVFNLIVILWWLFYFRKKESLKMRINS